MRASPPPGAALTEATTLVSWGGLGKPGLEQDGAAIRAALTMPWSNAQAEGQITKLKFLKRQMHDRANFEPLHRRVLLVRPYRPHEGRESHVTWVSPRRPRPVKHGQNLSDSRTGSG